MPEPIWKLPRDEPRPPAVSIIIPSHRPQFLPEAIASVFAQTCQDFQLVVNYRREWWGEKINDVVNASRGPFVCILPDDDLLHPTYLAKALDASRGGFDIIFSDIQFFGDRTDVYRLPDFGVNAQRHACVPWMTALIRRQLWDELGGFDPDQILQDSDFYLRAALAGAEAAHIREPLVLARQHAGNGAKLMDHSAAALKLQAKHPQWFPSQFIAPPAPGEPNDGSAFVAPVQMPERFRQLAKLAGS